MCCGNKQPVMCPECRQWFDSIEKLYIHECEEELTQ